MTATDRNSLMANGAALYHGTIMHARLQPFVHRFSYRVFSLLIDIDRLSAADGLRWFSHNRMNLFSFYDRDHGPRDGSPLRPYVDDMLQKAGIGNCDQIHLLCYPRVLGYVFNPLSVYFCYDRNSDPVAILYEVRNTFGGMHTYVAPVVTGQNSPAGIRQSSPKHFYVSPFLDMDMTYHFRLLPPGKSLNLRILQTRDGQPAFAAASKGRHQPFTDGNLLRSFATVPFLTLKVIFSIHWQAARLWFKGARFKDATARTTRETLLDEAKWMTEQSAKPIRGS